MEHCWIFWEEKEEINCLDTGLDTLEEACICILSDSGTDILWLRDYGGYGLFNFHFCFVWDGVKFSRIRDARELFMAFDRVSTSLA